MLRTLLRSINQIGRLLQPCAPAHNHRSHGHARFAATPRPLRAHRQRTQHASARRGGGVGRWSAFIQTKNGREHLEEERKEGISKPFCGSSRIPAWQSARSRPIPLPVPAPTSRREKSGARARLSAVVQKARRWWRLDCRSASAGPALTVPRSCPIILPGENCPVHDRQPIGSTGHLQQPAKQLCPRCHRRSGHRPE